MTSPALATANLSVGYGARGERRSVLERVSVAAQPGELICLLGPNGIGKSTLLRTMTGLQQPLWGDVVLGGTNLNELTPVDVARRIGVVLTTRVIVESLTVHRIVEIGRYPHLDWFGRLTTRDREVVDWAIGAVGAMHLADRHFSRLSDGERQRVMVARALAQEPVLLVLDEPTAFLDVLSRVELMGLLRQLTRRVGLAVIVSTHDLELALRSADTVWLLMPGGDVMTGAPEDVIVAGGIARAFEGKDVRFQPEERAFRWLSHYRGTATLCAAGLREAMAKSVLEREGFAVGSTTGAFVLDVNESGWRIDEEGARGESFAALAAYLRMKERSWEASAR